MKNIGKEFPLRQKIDVFIHLLENQEQNRITMTDIINFLNGIVAAGEHEGVSPQHLNEASSIFATVELELSAGSVQYASEHHVDPVVLNPVWRGNQVMTNQVDRRQFDHYNGSTLFEQRQQGPNQMMNDANISSVPHDLYEDPFSHEHMFLLGNEELNTQVQGHYQDTVPQSHHAFPQQDNYHNGNNAMNPMMKQNTMSPSGQIPSECYHYQDTHYGQAKGMHSIHDISSTYSSTAQPVHYREAHLGQSYGNSSQHTPAHYPSYQAPHLNNRALLRENYQRYIPNQYDPLDDFTIVIRTPHRDPSDHQRRSHISTDQRTSHTLKDPLLQDPHSISKHI
eukprot:TRINITY_DN1932_c0_g1_i2.p1 TRINITY_DN1932_c0_g1~~TRINITY_DN1932_c0_g1_i2.p1  ORF type:complete len:362 (-),score=52.16 TRINITY_DN1932_c0_g1_i2:43-1056(-)